MQHGLKRVEVKKVKLHSLSRVKEKGEEEEHFSKIFIKLLWKLAGEWWMIYELLLLAHLAICI